MRFNFHFPCLLFLVNNLTLLQFQLFKGVVLEDSSLYSIVGILSAVGVVVCLLAEYDDSWMFIHKFSTNIFCCSMIVAFSLGTWPIPWLIMFEVCFSLPLHFSSLQIVDALIVIFRVSFIHFGTLLWILNAFLNKLLLNERSSNFVLLLFFIDPLINSSTKISANKRDFYWSLYILNMCSQLLRRSVFYVWPCFLASCTADTSYQNQSPPS